MRVLVVGGTGGLGTLVCGELARRGVEAKPLGRRDGDLRDPEIVAGAATGADAIINCAGASVAMGLGRGWRGYPAVDTPIGLAVAEAARRAGVRVVYVSVAHPPALARTAYVSAHERVVAAMAELDAVIVRPTGFFSAYASLLPMIRRGLAFDLGDGRARTNPIDERELAAIVAESVRGDGPREITCGGPEILARREILERVVAASGRKVTVRGLPVWLARANGAVLRLVHPRLGQFVQFAAGLAVHDAIAPSLGARRLEDYLRAAAPGIAA